MKWTGYSILFVACCVICFFSLVGGYIVGRYSWSCKDCPQREIIVERTVECEVDRETPRKLNLCEQALDLQMQVQEAQEKLGL